MVADRNKSRKNTGGKEDFACVFHCQIHCNLGEKLLIVIAINRVSLIENVVYFKLMLVVDPKLSKPSTSSLFE